MFRHRCSAAAALALAATTAGATPAASIKREVPLHVQTVYKKNTPITLPCTDPKAMAFDGLRTWVVCDDTRTVVRYDVESNVSGGTVSLPSGGDPQGMAFDGTYVWVFTSNPNYAYKISTGGQVQTGFPIPLSGPTKGAAFDGDFIWVASGFNGGSVDRIRVSNASVTTFHTGIDGGAAIAFDGRDVWVTNVSNGTAKIDGVNGSVLFSDPALLGADGALQASFDGRYVWVPSSNENVIRKVDPQTNAVVATVATYPWPEGTAFDGRYLWVACTDAAGGIMLIDVKTNAVVDAFQLPGGAYPYQLAFDGSYMWVSTSWGASQPKLFKILAR